MFAFPYPAIIKHSTVQKYPAFFVLNRWLEFTLCDHHILLVHFMNYRVVRVTYAARFENIWPAHSANFENGIDFVQSDW